MYFIAANTDHRNIFSEWSLFFSSEQGPHKFGDDQAHYKPESRNPKPTSRKTNLSIKNF